MRLLIVGINFAPELTGVGKFTGEMARWLAHRGHEISVITTRPYYPEWKRAPGFSGYTWSVESWEGCHVMRCPLYVPRRQSGLQRVLHLASFGMSAIPAVLARVFTARADVVLVMAPTLFSAPAALLAARFMSAKAWLHVLDLEVDAASELGFIRSKPVIEAARKIERWIYARFDLVSTISTKMREAILRKGVPCARLILFPNWVDTGSFRPLPQPVPLRQELGIPVERCVAIYSGSMGRKQGLQHVIAAARILAKGSGSSPLFLLAGAGPMRPELESMAQDLGNVRFLPLQPSDRFNEFLNVGDIHLLPQQRGASDLVMPSKLLAILAAGRPVIATALPDSEIARTLAGVGVVTPPEDPMALAAAISRLVSDPESRRAMGKAAAELARSSMHSETILRSAEAALLALLEEAKSPIVSKGRATR
jgi:colanic acid biosynthesis glycosyl transferase WcaI